MSFFYCRSITEIENEPKRASPLDKMGWTVVLRVYWPLARCCTWTIFSSWYRRTVDHSNDRVRAERFGRSSPLMLFQTVFHFHPIRWAKFPNNVGHHQCNHKCWHIPRGILSVRSSWPLSRDWWLSGKWERYSITHKTTFSSFNSHRQWHWCHFSCFVHLRFEMFLFTLRKLHQKYAKRDADLRCCDAN